MATTPTILAGISFPFRVQGNGLPAAAKGTEVIRSAFVVLLRQKKRTRVMRPDSGMNLHRFIFEDEGPIQRALITREILTQAATQLPQVSIQDIEFQDVNQVTEVNVKYIIQGVADQTGFIPLTNGG